MFACLVHQIIELTHTEIRPDLSWFWSEEVTQLSLVGTPKPNAQSKLQAEDLRPLACTSDDCAFS